MKIPTQATEPLHPKDAAADGVYVTSIGLHLPGALSYDEWGRAGQRLSKLIDSTSWWLGDWLVFGKEHFPDRYLIAIRSAGLRYQTLRNYAWVSRRFAFDRRRSCLTFQHHAEIASLTEDRQEYWLDQAEDGNWTTKQLRSQLKGSMVSLRGRPETQHAEIPRIRVQDSRLRLWQQAAHESGTEFDLWVSTVLDHAAEQTLGG